MPLSVIALMAEKACCQIENIVDKESKESDRSNEEIASSKDELTQAVTISLCSLSSQTCCDPLSGCLGSYGVTSRSSRPEVVVPACWVKFMDLRKVSMRVIGCPEEHCLRPNTVVSFSFSFSFSILTTP